MKFTDKMTPIWIWSNFYGQMLTHFVDALNQHEGQEKIEDTCVEELVCKFKQLQEQSQKWQVMSETTKRG